MFNSPIYKNHFPVKTHRTNFDEKEKRTLCKWAKMFKTELLARDFSKSQRNYVSFPTYDMNVYNEKTMLGMIEKNYFDDTYLAFLNFMIYRHKYNEFLSIWLFPVMNRSLCEKYFGSQNEIYKNNDL